MRIVRWCTRVTRPPPISNWHAALSVSISVRHLAESQPAAKTKLGIETTTAEVLMMVVLEETFTSECKTFNCVEIETIH